MYCARWAEGAWEEKDKNMKLCKVPDDKLHQNLIKVASSARPSNVFGFSADELRTLCFLASKEDEALHKDGMAAQLLQQYASQFSLDRGFIEVLCIPGQPSRTLTPRRSLDPSALLWARFH